ncbi:MAG: tetratricopeptide repeat protein [Bacteroidetes bacterium]|nr:tetratricopeptide repeat protein [Bacteroidota bacterium]
MLKILLNKSTYKFIFVSAFLFVGCSNQQDKNVSSSNTTIKSIGYLNHSDTATYVEKQACRLCHQSIYDSFIQTGMGQSFDTASSTKSASFGLKESGIYDKFLNLHYQAYWKSDQFYFNEFRLANKDTTHSRVEQVDYIIGSGQHTNSHLLNSNGYLYQMPMTFYTQKKHWDLPPGFESGNNTRFSRKIGLECMSCHNGYPDFVVGSENKYSKVQNGIDCERCHGPGSIHVEKKSAGEKIDTSKYIDYSIVNPAKLPIDLQFDLCQRCHLQGNAVLKEGKSFYDFKPGMKLSEVMTVFLPRYNDSEESFIMASHADRLKQSKCFLASSVNAQTKNELKPYKNGLTCVTCHNPHVSVKKLNSNHFNAVCSSCHKSSSACAELESKRLAVSNNCVSCHMPKSGSSDIPHVSITDHFIRKPLDKKKIAEIRKFVRLAAINQKNPDSITIAKAYLNQYEKFEQEKFYLDSASNYLSNNNYSKEKLRELIRYYFFKADNTQLVSFAEKNKLLTQFNSKSWMNDDAWACYRVGQAYQQLGNTVQAYSYYQRAIELAPFILDFKNKYATTLIALDKSKEAETILRDIIKEDGKYAAAYCNLGYLLLLQGNSLEAEKNYKIALSLDPNYEQALLNLAGLCIYKKDNTKALYYVREVLKVNPNNNTAKSIFQQLN